MSVYFNLLAYLLSCKVTLSCDAKQHDGPSLLASTHSCTQLHTHAAGLYCAYPSLAQL